MDSIRGLGGFRDLLELFSQTTRGGADTGALEISNALADEGVRARYKLLESKVKPAKDASSSQKPELKGEKKGKKKSRKRRRQS